MKHLHLKKIIYTVLGGVLGLALFISISPHISGADVGGQTVRQFSTAGGTLGADQFQLSREKKDRENSTTLEYDTSVLHSNNENAIFRMVGTSVFDRIMSFGRARFDTLAVGYPDRNTGNAKLAVDGTITIKGLAHGGTTAVPACVNDFGVIMACTATLSCTGTTPTHATACTGDADDLTADVAKTAVDTCSDPAADVKCEYSCDSGYHEDNGSCVADAASVNGVCGNSVTKNQCSAGTYDASPADSATHYLWSCLGSNGGSDATNCQEVIPASPINGSCNNATQNGCTAGLGNDLAISDTTTLWRWRCDGVNGGSNSGTCQILKSGSGGGGCFVADTVVKMADGTSKNIQNIEIGEMVLGYNNEISEVKGLHRPLLGEGQSNELYSFNGGRYFVNTDHPFMTTHGWKAINPVESMDIHGMNSVTKLEIGDILITEKGSIILETLDSIEGDSETQLYNLMLDGNHTYYADGYSVHNKKRVVDLNIEDL